MKILYSRIFIAIRASVLLMGSPVLAEDVKSDSAKKATALQGQKIVRECKNIQNQLGRLRSNDALIRVNLGQNYEVISSRLMANLNTRIVSNKLNGSELVALSAEFSENLEYFRENYQIYERDLTKLSHMDCSKAADKFYDQLEIVRYQRSELNFNTTKLHEIAEEYQKALERFEETIK